MITVSSTIPPVSRWRRHDKVEWLDLREEIDEGVMRERNASAPGPEMSCWTLKEVNCLLRLN